MPIPQWIDMSPELEAELEEAAIVWGDKLRARNARRRERYAAKKQLVKTQATKGSKEPDAKPLSAEA